MSISAKCKAGGPKIDVFQIFTVLKYENSFTFKLRAAKITYYIRQRFK